MVPPGIAERRAGRPHRHDVRGRTAAETAASREARVEAAVERALSDMVLRARSDAGVTAALETMLDALGPVLGLRAAAVTPAGGQGVRWGDGHRGPGEAIVELSGGGSVAFTPGGATSAAQLRGLHRLVDMVDATLAAHEAQRVMLCAERRRERTRLAEQVHDQAVQLLFAAEMELALADPETCPRMQRTRELVTLAQASLRTLIDDAERAGADLLEGLAATACALESDFGCHVALRPGPDVACRAAGLPAATVATLVRLVRETTVNALKHGATDRVSVGVRVSGGGSLVVVICDDGLGIGPSAEPSHGLRSLQRAMLDCGGSFRIGPRLHGGTRVVATMPL